MARLRTPPLQRVPPGSVVTVPGTDFGREPRAGQRPPLADAKQILAKSPFENPTPPILPDIGSIDRKPGRGIVTEKPVIAKREVPVVTGAETRKSDAPLDRELKERRMLGGRPPLVTTPVPAETKQQETTAEPRRRTGAFDRSVPQRVETPVTSKPTEPAPTYVPRPTPRPTAPERKPDPPAERNTRPSPPFNPQPRPQPPPPRTESPGKYEPSPRREAPAPRPSPPPRTESPKPAPPKSEPKPEPRKPSPPLASEKKGKDGK